MSAEAGDRVPSVEQLREVREAYLAFWNDNSYRSNQPWRQEDGRLKNFIRMADALLAVQPLIDTIQGWPDQARRALPLLIEGFTEVARDWGWERVAEPEPQRSAFLEERRSWFRENIERPLCEAALSWQRGCKGLECPTDVDVRANEGNKKGFSPTMSLEEGMSRFEDAEETWIHACCIGKRYPKFSDDDDDETLKKLRGGHSLLEWSLGEVEAEDRSKSVHNIPTIAPESSPAASGGRLSEKKGTERVINVDDAPGSEIWIPANEAVKVARCLSCEVSLSQINKESNSGSFKGRESQSSRARREVELGTYVRWLWRKYQPKMGS